MNSGRNGATARANSMAERALKVSHISRPISRSGPPPLRTASTSAVRRRSRSDSEPPFGSTHFTHVQPGCACFRGEFGKPLRRARFEVLAPVAVVDAHRLRPRRPGKPPDRLPEALAFDIPQRDIDGGQRGHQNRAVAIARELVVVAVPVVLDAAGVIAGQKRREPPDRLLDNFHPPGDGAFAQAGDAGIGLHFEEQIVAVLDGVFSCGHRVRIANLATAANSAAPARRSRLRNSKAGICGLYLTVGSRTKGETLPYRVARDRLAGESACPTLTVAGRITSV